jgi:hypothetical protein
VNTLLEKLNEMLFEQGDTEAATNEKQPEQTRQESPKPEPIVAQEARAGESTNTTEMLQFLQSKVANHSPGSQETLAKFAKNLQVLEEFIPDENVRYRAAASQVSVSALLKAYRGAAKPWLQPHLSSSRQSRLPVRVRSSRSETKSPISNGKSEGCRNV